MHYEAQTGVFKCICRACCTNCSLRYILESSLTPLYALALWEVKIQRSPISKPFPPLYQGRITSPFCNWDDWIPESRRGQDVQLTDCRAAWGSVLVMKLAVHPHRAWVSLHDTRSSVRHHVSTPKHTFNPTSSSSSVGHTFSCTASSNSASLLVQVMRARSSCMVLKAPSIWDKI